MCVVLVITPACAACHPHRLSVTVSAVCMPGYLSRVVLSFCRLVMVPPAGGVWFRLGCPHTAGTSTWLLRRGPGSQTAGPCVPGIAPQLRMRHAHRTGQRLVTQKTHHILHNPERLCIVMYKYSHRSPL